jgi:transforming growth factor-beta-induced protein
MVQSLGFMLSTAFPLVLVLLPKLAVAQTLQSAISVYPQCSQFNQILTDHPEISTQLLANATNVTVLVPSNSALNKYAIENGQSLDGGDLTNDDILAILQYHVAVKQLKGSDFADTGPQGLTVPTLLTDRDHNNRSAGADLVNAYGAAADGQVLFFSTSPISDGTVSVKVRKFKRQATPSTNVRGGLDGTTNLTIVDGKWTGGLFQIVNE